MPVRCYGMDGQWLKRGWCTKDFRRVRFSRLWSTFFKSSVTNSKDFRSKSTHDVFVWPYDFNVTLWIRPSVYSDNTHLTSKLTIVLMIKKIIYTTFVLSYWYHTVKFCILRLVSNHVVYVLTVMSLSHRRITFCAVAIYAGFLHRSSIFAYCVAPQFLVLLFWLHIFVFPPFPCTPFYLLCWLHVCIFFVCIFLQPGQIFSSFA